jgi:carbon-monoxide dehydrogenase medium subunit
MKAAPFVYHRPKSLSEAVELLAEWGPQEGRILAGGQTLVPTMAYRMARPMHLIDINGVPELGSLSLSQGVLKIGACIRHVMLEMNDLPGPLGRLLRKVAVNIAHFPIRTRGTFCGSIANADPSSEWCCTATALDGTVVLLSTRGERRVPATEFIQGVMTTALEEDELVAAVELPELPEGTRTGFKEFSRRKGDFAIAMALVSYRLEGETIVEPRVTVGGAEAQARRIPEAEAELMGQPASREVFERAAEKAAAAIDPMEDLNNTASYRRHLVRTLVSRALAEAD